jgi:hypothetical protein
MKFRFALASALSLSCLVASAAQAATVNGINSASLGGGIYTIDVSSGLAVKYADTTGAALGTNVNSGNSLANNHNNFYFSSFSKGVNDTLFSQQGGVTYTAGKLVGHVASGTYANGGFYYMTQGSSAGASSLHKVTFDASGHTIVSDTLFALTGAKDWTFGDIVVKGSTLYGVAIARTGPEFFSVNLNTGAVSTIASLSTNLQLAFAGSDLVGISTATGAIYTLDTTSGVLTDTGNVVHAADGSALYITDLTGAVPEPASVAMVGIGLVGLVSYRRLSSRAKKV